MTDLNPSLTDFDKSLITEAPKPPELKPFSVWSEENQLTEADPQSYVQYSDYVREGYLEQGAYTPSVEGEISGSLNSKLADLGVVDEEAIQALTATKEPSFEEKFEYVRAGLNSDDEDWMTLTEYKAGEKVVAAGGTVQPYQDKIAGLKLKSEEVVNRRFDEVKRNLVESNQIPLAYVTNETGERELLVGDAAENMTVNQAIKASKIGGVSFKDGLAAQALLSPVAGLDIKLYKFKQIAEISESIAELAQQDSSVAEHVTGHTLQLARESQNAWDATTQSLTRGLSDLMTAVGVESEESNDKKKRVYIASRQSFDNTVEYITDKLNSSGANYKAEDVRDAYEAHVIHEGARRGTFKLHQDPSEAGKNLYKTALGPVLNPAVFAREEDMINTLAAHPELTAQQKKLFAEKRVDVLKQNFASYSKLLSESAVGDDWAKALIDGRQAGRDDLDIFDDFVAKDENFNEFADSAKGIAYSVWDSVATLVYAAPAIMGADWAKDGLANTAQRQSDRREVAQIFGEQYGLFQDVSESVAPLIVDIAATTALATVSGGTLGAGYLALRSTVKGGAQLTAKGFAKALTSNVLRASTKQGYKEVADKAANVLIRESLEKGGRAKTVEAIEAFNKVASSKFNIGVAGFVPAATRSGAMTYASLYNQLRKDPELSEDEAHDRALGFALTSGAITGAITAGFSMIGRGGVEDALLKGMTFRESKAVFQAMGNTSGISDTLVAGAMKTVMNASIKKYGAFALGKKIAKNAVDESLEEGLDQLVNSFVEDVALNQDTPMLERMTQVWHAAQVGGILGGGVPTIQAGARFVGYTPMDQRESRIRMANEFAEQVSSELEGTGSPLTAQQVRQIITTRAQSRGAAEAAAELAPTPSEGTSTVTEQSLLRTENAKRSKEIAQEISKLSDESTLPKKEEEREAEVALREQRRIELEQESAAISQKEQNLEVAAQSPTTPDFALTDQKVDPVVFLQSLNDSSPLDVEIALENIRNQQSVSVRNSEPVTVLETPFDYGRKSPREIKDYTGPYIDFTQEQANAESAGVTLQGESRTNISSANNSVRGFDPTKSKRYSSRPSPNTFRYEESPFSGPDAEEKANRLIGFAMGNGFPINPDPNVNYGLPMPPDSSRQSASEFVSSAVYTAYPKLAPPKNAKLDPDNEKRPFRTYFDPVSGKTVTQPVKFFVDDRGNGVFDNDPISIIEMLRAGKTVKVPRSFNRANLNPAIRIKNEMVSDVVGPTADGTLLESKVTNARGVSSIGPNNTRASAIASIRFKPATLPEGVPDFDKNGSPITDGNFSNTTSIKRKINRFALELEKTGDETNRNAQALLEANDGELNEEFRMVAFESAKQEFLFNAQLFSLRAKVEAFGEGTNPTTPFDELVAQTGSKNVDQAAQKLLPFIKVESNKELTGETILGLFVEQKLLNNPDFANNTTPTFDTLLKKAANEFKNQQEKATSLRQQRAASTLPFDITPDQFKNPKVSSWVFNFGENPVGDFASPQDISNTVSGAMKKAVNTVNTSPDLRKGIVKVILEDVLEDPEMEDMVENASSKDLFGIFASWLSSGNGDTRPSVNSLVEILEDKVLIGSEDFLNALQLVRLVTPSDGASYENSDAVSDFQAQFNAGAETEITAEEAKNTMIALTKAVRTHLSRSNISAAERAVITAENKADIERLGLESGNPDSVIEALKEVAKNSKIPSHKFVATLLLRDTAFIKKIKFVMGEAKADIAGKYVKGKDGSDSVFINVTSGNGRGLVNTLLEEYVHAFISGTISNPPSSKQGIVNQLSSVFDFAKETYESQKESSGPVPSLENALVDLNEFTAQFLLSEDVQKHFKNLKPTNNSSPFDSFLINIAMLFPNVGIGSAKEVAESLGDIIDVGSNPRKGPPTNAGALAGAIANNATLSSSPVFSPEYMAERKAERREALREMQDDTEEKRLESKRLKDEVEREKFLSLIPEEDRSKALPLLNYLRGLIPFGMELEFVTESDGSSSFVQSDSSAVYINLPLMLSQTGGVGDIAGRAIAGVIINEELVHSASWSSMTDGEVQNYINSLSDSDFVDIAKEYHVGNEPRLAAAIVSLQSSDPQVVAKAKYGLAQEKLRMHFQKVTRGFTTEDDNQFWKSKPSLLKILGRYFRGIINRWVAKREQIGPAADVALNKLIIEMRAIEAGFVRQPTKMAFDTKNPTEVFQMFEVVNQDFVGLASAPVEDVEYLELAKDPEKNWLELRTMVERRAKAAGYETRTKHATGATFDAFDRGEIPEFDPDTNIRGFHVSNEADTFSSYRYQRTDNKVLDLFVKKGRTIDRVTAQQMVARGEETDGFPSGFDTVVFSEPAGFPTQKQQRDFDQGEPVSLDGQNERSGYFVIKKDSALGGAELYLENNPNETITTYEDLEEAFSFHDTEHLVVRSPDQLKSADPITRDANGNVIPLSQRFDESKSSILYSAPVAGATTPAEIPPEIASASDPIVKHIYVKEDGKFYEKIKNGYIKIQQSLDQFEGMAVMLHQPDGAMAGTLEVEGDKVVDGKGGVYYPVMFGDQGYFWASTKDAAVNMAENLNKISKRNNGTILMALTSAPIEKMFSSTTMATGAVNLFATLAKNPKKYGITEAVVNRAIVNASKERLVLKKKDKDTGVETTTIKEFSRKLKLKDGLAKNIEEMKKNLLPEESVFPQRGSFVAQIASAIADSMKLPTAEVQKKFNPKEKAAFDKKKNQALNIANLLAGDKNLYNKSLIPTGNLKMASVMQGMADLFAEPLVKTFQQFQQMDKKASGRVYAVLSMKGEVEAVETDFHDSYPYSIRSTSGETPVVHVLSESNLWKDVVYSAKKPNPKKAADPYDGNTDPIKKSEEDSIFPPSVGVSQRELIFRKADEGVETVKLPLYSAPTAAAAAPSSKPTGSTINFAAVVDLLEIPVYELETGKPQNFIMEFLNKVFAGELPEAFRRLIQNRDAYKRLTEANVVAYKQEMDKLIEENYGGYEYAPMDLIALAQGHYTGNIVTEEVLKDIDKDYEAAHADAEKKRKVGLITEEEADSLKGLAHNARTEATDKAYEEAITSREADRDAALRELAKESPKLAAHIIDIRQRLIIPLQKKLVKSGLDDNIGVKISETGGVYITRSYKMFTDSSYLQKVREDPNYQVVRDEAMRFFNKQFKDKKFEELVEGGMDKSRAEVEARILLEKENQSYPHKSYAQEVLNTFLMRYDEGGRDSTTASPKHYKMIEDNLKRRKDLPVEIRNLLGEIGSEAGTDLILRTYSTVATLASQQAFLNQLVAFGKETGVMVTVEEKLATKENRVKYANFVAARSGAPSKNDPLSGMQVDPEFKKLLDTTLNDSFSMDYADTAEKAVKGAVGLAANLSGKAMAAKTLGSIGFYLRNGIGNLLFGTSQGFLRYDKMIAEMAKGTFGVLNPFNEGEIDPELNELIGLNIKGDELRAGVMRDLLNGRITPDGIRKQIEDLGEKTKLNKATKALAIIEKKAQDLSAALDAAYKVAYYNHELAILKEAQAADTSTVEDGKVRVNNLANMSDTQIKRLAARKVVMTSQAYSQAPPAVAAYTKSGLGLLFAPFIRFKMEVPRIVINTYKLASEEIASGNPVLVRRGKTRMIWMTGTIGVLSSALPMILAALSGIGDEEDEAMRASIPDYLRGHTFFYYRWNGELKSVDLTYVNPYSLLVDPFLRAYENIRSGEFTEAGAALALGLVRDQYLDDQILAGAVSEARRNLNPSTGKPIWNKGADGPVEAGSKILGYIAKEAYAPRLGKDFVEGWSTGSLKGMTLEIMDGAMPARVHDVDLQKQYSRYLLDLNKRYNNVKSGLNAVKRNVPMSDGDVADIIDENIEDRRLLNYELMRINKGFASLGLTNTDLLKGMKDKKLGRDRVALLSKGYMDKPSFKYIIEGLLDPRTDEYGRARAQQVYDHASKLNRYIPVRPITESE